jgi:hypothetical protein
MGEAIADEAFSASRRPQSYERVIGKRSEPILPASPAQFEPSTLLAIVATFALASGSLRCGRRPTGLGARTLTCAGGEPSCASPKLMKNTSGRDRFQEAGNLSVAVRREIAHEHLEGTRARGKASGGGWLACISLSGLVYPLPSSTAHPRQARSGARDAGACRHE